MCLHPSPKCSRKKVNPKIRLIGIEVKITQVNKIGVNRIKVNKAKGKYGRTGVKKATVYGLTKYTS